MSNPEGLQAALQRLQSNTARLLEIQQALQAQESSPDSLLCLHCSRENPPGSRFCQGCQARLLTAAPSHPGSTPRPWAAQLQTLVSAAHDFQAQRSDRQAFVAVIDDYQQRTERAHQQLRDMSLPWSTEPASDPQQLYLQARQAMQEALQELSLGTEGLRRFADSRDPQELEEALERCHCGQAHMESFAALHDQWQ